MASLYPSQLNVDSTPAAADVVVIQKDGESEVKQSSLTNLFGVNGALIKSAYENEAETNAYPDADVTKVGHLTIGSAFSIDNLNETALGAISGTTSISTDDMLTDSDIDQAGGVQSYDADTVIDSGYVATANDYTNADAAKVATVNQSGDTASRPVAGYIGEMFFDTDLGTTGLPIWWDDTQWVDATGTAV